MGKTKKNNSLTVCSMAEILLEGMKGNMKSENIIEKRSLLKRQRNFQKYAIWSTAADCAQQSGGDVHVCQLSRTLYGLLKVEAISCRI